MLDLQFWIGESKNGLVDTCIKRQIDRQSMEWVKEGQLCSVLENYYELKMVGLSEFRRWIENADRQIDRQTDGQIDRQMDIWIVIYIDRQIDRQIARQIDTILSCILKKKWERT